MFHYIDTFDNDYFVPKPSIDGTLALHCVRSVGTPHFIQTRDLSCFCPKCYYDCPLSDCPNTDYIDEWRTSGWDSANDFGCARKKLLDIVENSHFPLVPFRLQKICVCEKQQMASTDNKSNCDFEFVHAPTTIQSVETTTKVCSKKPNATSTDVTIFDPLPYLGSVDELLAGFLTNRVVASTIACNELRWPVHGVVDTVAVGCMPSDSPKGYLPMETSGDGTCFFWASSTAVYGTEDMHSQLRRRVTMEFATNASRYLNDEWLSLRMGDGFMSSMSVSHLIATYTKSFNQLPTTDDFVVREVLNNETLETAADGTWCGLWHFKEIVTAVKQGPLRLQQNPGWTAPV